MAFYMRSGSESTTAPATTYNIYHHFHPYPIRRSTNHPRNKLPGEDQNAALDSFCISIKT